jgi:hypothetical protein
MAKSAGATGPAIVSEVFISDYLKVLSTEMAIQPFNRLTVDAHRRDELAHGSVFKGLAKCLYGSLNAREREFFIEELPKPVHWFANIELDVWQAMLQQVGFRATDTVISNCRSANEETWRGSITPTWSPWRRSRACSRGTEASTVSPGKAW